MTAEAIDTFLQPFNGVIDPRIENANRRHELGDRLVLTILAVMCGADGWTAVEEFGHAKLKYLKRFLKLPNGIPAHDTLGDLFARWCPEQLQAGFLSGVNALVSVSDGESVAIDGKTLRPSYDSGAGRGAIPRVSAWASANRRVLGQVKVEAKSNEITAIPALLPLLPLDGAIVTIDAMGCQKAIAEQSIEGQGDYVLSLKGNQGQLHEDVELFLESAYAKGFAGTAHDYHETLDKDHGRIEVRRYWITDPIEWWEQKAAWAGLCRIGRVESERHLGDKLTTERRYFMASIEADAELFAHAVRTHWTLENQRHWSLDMTFREDDCRVRQGHAAQHFATLRPIALNLLKNEMTSKRGIQSKRLRAGWDHRYLAKVLAVGQK